MPGSYIYRNWDGTQQIMPFDGEAVMEAISDDVLSGGDVQRALRRLMQQGYQTREGARMMGLRDLMERLRSQRRQKLRSSDMSGIMDDIAKKLDEIIAQERGDIEKRLEESRKDLDWKKAERTASQEDENLQKMLENMAARREQQLADLPESPAGKVKQLREYDFMSPEARQQFEELLAQLQQQVLNQTFKGLKGSMQGMTPEQRAEMRNMLHDLNKMLEDRSEGREPKFQEFKEKYGHFFPPNIENLDQLLEHLAQQMRAMDSLMQSMSGEQRAELESLMEGLMQDEQLEAEMARLASNLQQMMPTEGRPYPFSGDEPVTLSEAMRLMEQLQGMEELEQQLDAARYGNGVDDIDPQKMGELVGAEEAQALQQLQDLAKQLEEEGYLENVGGKMELTPRGIRKIGQKALQDIFQSLKRDAFGKHAVSLVGRGGERTDDSKTYEFGDPFYIDLHATLMNAVEREGKGSPVQIAPQDFEVYRTELQTQSATVLMLDMSRSMLLRGCYVAAKKVALALNHLIRTQFPRDTIYIVGFSAYARELKAEALPQLDWSEYEYGTNLHHALMLGRTLLARHKTPNKQMIVITDGEPTAHLLEDGQYSFQYPPSWATIHETLREVTRCTRDRIVINTFMLERSPDLTEFVNQMTAINRGRAFYATPEALGEYILVDYVNSKRKRIK
ncbi:MAG: VWA domain-containing protein [Chloroflexia bacterium]